MIFRQENKNLDINFIVFKDFNVNVNIKVYRFIIYFLIDVSKNFFFNFFDNIFVGKNIISDDGDIIVFLEGFDLENKIIEYFFFLDIKFVVDSRIFIIDIINYVLKNSDNFFRKNILFVFYKIFIFRRVDIIIFSIFDFIED